MYRWDAGVSAKGRWATSAWTWWRGCVLPSICVFCYLLISLLRFPTPDFLTVWTFTHRTCKKETPVYQMFWCETVVDTPVTAQLFSAKTRKNPKVRLDIFGGTSLTKEGGREQGREWLQQWKFTIPASKWVLGCLWDTKSCFVCSCHFRFLQNIDLMPDEGLLTETLLDY